MFNYEKANVLIWGKTYPELSYLHTETVCTGGVREDGRPVRLYPISLRYLDGEQRFGLYQWIEAEIAKDPRDVRPESFRVKEGSIVCGEKVPTTADEWGKRSEFIFKYPDWQFESVEDLWTKHKTDGTSLGIVTPAEIIAIKEKRRTDAERAEFEKKLDDLRVMNEAKRAQIPLIEVGYTIPEIKSLSYVSSRFEIKWRCFGSSCPTHTTQVLDWGLLELMRKVGVEQANAKLVEICDLSEYSLKFFMGNIKGHPDAFTIVGLWYPKKESTPWLF